MSIQAYRNHNKARTNIVVYCLLTEQVTYTNKQMTGQPPVHTAAVVKNWLAAKQIQLLPHPPPPPPPYSPDLAPADFFLFRKVKEQLAGLNLTQESLKSTWEGVMCTIGEDEFATTFLWWCECSEKCVRIQDNYVEKS
jgi:hypothetical protein